MVGRCLIGDCIMQHKRLCDDEIRLRQAEHSGQLRKAVGAYSIGVRTTDVVNTLAECHVWATNIGEWIPCPVNLDRSTWADTLDSLVLDRLGDRRCLDCGSFIQTPEPTTECLRAAACLGQALAYVCPHCESTATEPIQCTEGVAR